MRSRAAHLAAFRTGGELLRQQVQALEIVIRYATVAVAVGFTKRT